MSLPSFRPRSAPELVDAAIQLGRRHYGPLVTLGALVAIPGLVIGLLTQSLIPDPAQVATAGAEALLIFPAAIVSMCWLFVGFGAFVASAAAAYVDGRRLEPADALQRALRRAWPLIGGNLLASLLVFLILMAGGFLLAIAAGLVAAVTTGVGGGSAIGAVVGVALGFGIVAVGLLAGVLLWARYVNITAAVMLEGASPLGALRRSRELVRGAMLRTAGVVVLMVVLYMVVYLTLWALAAVVIRSAELSANVAGVLVVLIYPFIGAMLTLLYFDLRIRREGYDIELMSRALEQPPAQGATA